MPHRRGPRRRRSDPPRAGRRRRPLLRRIHPLGSAGRIHLLELDPAGDGPPTRSGPPPGHHTRDRDARLPRPTPTTTPGRPGHAAAVPGAGRRARAAAHPRRDRRPCAAPGGTAQPHIARALTLLEDLDLAFIGLGPADFHGPLRPGNNFFSTQQLAAVQAAGAAAQLNQRFLDAAGHPLTTPFNDTVVAITLAQLRRAHTRVVIAGGSNKLGPLHAALRGRWIDALVTDLTSARHLITYADQTTPAR